ncbi:MAG: lysophospholipid acyltransferase family protein [Verrucomicrobiota bacterium]
MKGFWKQIRYRIEWILLKFAAAVVPKVPRSLLLRLADMLAGIAWCLDRRSRAVAMENLSAVFGGEDGWDEKRIGRTAKDSFRYFARAMIDLFWSPRLDQEKAAALIRYDEKEFAPFDETVKDGAILLTPHYGNFEWIAYGMGFRGHQFCIIAQDFKNGRLTEIFSQLRSGSGHEVIRQEGAMLKLMRQLKKGGLAAFLPDLTVKPSQAATVIECFGLKASVTLLHAVLAQRTRKPMYGGVAVPQPDGTYLMRGISDFGIEEDDSLQVIAQKCWDKFEPIIRENPAPWLWMYKHWRYRPRGDEGEKYPTYANYSKAFDRLCEESFTSSE